MMSSTRTKFRKLARQVKSAELIRLAKGVYACPEDLEGLEGDFYRATLLCGKRSAICLFSALQYYGLTEQMFGGVWILIPYSRTPGRTRSIHFVRSRTPYFQIGIEEEERFRITNIERTIVDAFRYGKRIGISTAVQALKKAIQDKLTTRDKVFLMAKKLRAEKKILPYLESM